MTDKNDYADDHIYVTEQTDIDEIFDFVERRVTEPYQDGENTVWNFSTHDLIEDSLDLHAKREDEFVVPYPASGPWGMMFVMLPERVREAETLVWRDDKNTYYAYSQFYRAVADERMDQFQHALSRKLSELQRH